MSSVRTFLRLGFWLLPIFIGGSAAAQVPPHQPGTICFTPQFWCWMQYPNFPGQVCYCQTQYGPVRGVTG
jgi:hypothetical protein